MKRLSLFLFTLFISCIQNVNYNHIFEPMPGFLIYGLNLLKDHTPPEFNFTSPYSFEVNYSRNRSVLVVYDEPISTTSVNQDTLKVFIGSERVSGKVVAGKNSVQFIPDTYYSSNAQHRAVLQNTVTDINGNKQPVFKEESIEFTVGNDIDTTPPTLKSTTPANNATDTPLNTAIQLVFSENLSFESASDENFVLKQGENIIDKTIVYYGSVVQLKPVGGFQSNTKYTVSIKNTVKDLSGNTLATEQTISFTTSDISDRTPPTVTSVVPLDNSVDVANNALVVANLSEEVDAFSFNRRTYFVEEISNNGSNVLVDGNLTVESKSLIFRPTKSYRLEQKHRVTLRGSISDLSGNSMGADKTFSFTTGRLVTYTVGGTITGLNGTLVLQNNGTNDTTISTNGNFTFSNAVANTYYVSIKEQPVGQTCTVTGGSGTSTGNVTNISINCTTASYTIGGLVGGLTSGTLVLQNNTGDDLSINANGSFQFTNKLLYNSDYNVTVLTQPVGLVCNVNNGTGKAIKTILDIAVSCAAPGSATYTIGGTVSGLNGTLVLKNNGGDELTLTANAPYTFTTQVANLYNVTVSQQPSGQTCTVSNSNGTASSNITNANVTCTTSTYTIGGLIGGLTTGTLVLQNGSETISKTASGGFTFTTPVAYNNGYNVTIATQPAGLNCIVSNGSGTVTNTNITDIAVSCGTPTYTIGGSISGLSGTVKLKNNGGDELTLTANAPYTFTTQVANLYNVTVSQQPTGQTCTVSSGIGTASSNITNANVTCITSTYTIGGLIGGLTTGTLVLQNGSETISKTASGGFTFTTPVTYNNGYSVTISSQPAGLNCIVSNGSGTVTNTNITDIAVSCGVPTYTIGGSISGLSGTLKLKNNGGNELTLTANAPYTFTTQVANLYNVTVSQQPTGQTCTVSSGIGTASANITNANVTCTTSTYTIGGLIGGLTTGTLVLQNGSETISKTASGGFTFTTPVAYNNGYSVTISSQPAGLNCIVSNGSGTVTNANITDIAVSCGVPTYTIGGSVSGLSGTLKLKNNGGNELILAANAPYTFTTQVANLYNVTVSQQPTGQTCTVSNGIGTASSNITNANVTCTTSTYTIGGLIGGLTTGTLVLQNSSETISKTASGGFTFTTPVAYNNGYSVTISSQPAGLNCIVSNGSGTVTNTNITDIAVSCGVPTYTIGGSISGLSGTLKLKNNGGNELTLTANAPYTFTTQVANLYNVTISQQPTGQTCTVSSGSGTASSNITNANVTCTTSTYTIGGLIGGLTTGTLVLQNGSETISKTASGSFTFTTPVAYNNGYSVTISSQPAGLNCIVSNGSGTVTNTNITDIAVSCGTPTYTIGGSISGLSGTVKLKNNGGDELTLTANAPYTFTTQVANLYNVTVSQQPTGQTCTVSNSSGTASANVTNANVTCTTSTYTIGGLIGGLTTGTLVLQNGSETISKTASGGFTFTTPVAYNNGYSVTIATQPAGLVCTVSNGSGTVTSINITDIVVSCAVPSSPTYTIGGSVSGLSGTLKLKNNGGDELTLAANAPYTFTTQVANLYNVTVSQQPTGQACTVSNSSGTASANVTNANVTCTTSTYTIGGFVSGLGSGLSVVLQNTINSESKTINANGVFSFTTPVTHGGSYNVTVQTHPTNQSCSVTNGVGSNITGNITNVIVGCSNLPGTTVQSFTDLGDGTIRDNNTLLIWQKCSMGFNNDTNCTDDGNTTNNTATWANAGIYCTGLANLPTANPRTWRLPSKDELFGLVDYTTTSGASIKTLFFPNTIADYYWSSTTYAPNTSNAWLVDFFNGNVVDNIKTSNNYVRCVSGP